MCWDKQFIFVSLGGGQSTANQSDENNDWIMENRLVDDCVFYIKGRLPFMSLVSHSTREGVGQKVYFLDEWMGVRKFIWSCASKISTLINGHFWP